MGTLLTTEEVADILKIKAHTVRELIKRGEIKAMKVSNRLLRIDEDDLNAYLQRLKEKS